MMQNEGEKVKRFMPLQTNPFSNDTKRTLGLCCVHITQLMTHPAIYTLPSTLQLFYKPLTILQKVTKSQKVHISSRDGLQKLHNISSYIKS